MELTTAQQCKLEVQRITHAMDDIFVLMGEMHANRDVEGLQELRTQLFQSRHLQAAIFNGERVVCQNTLA